MRSWMLPVRCCWRALHACLACTRWEGAKGFVLGAVGDGTYCLNRGSELRASKAWAKAHPAHPCCANSGLILSVDLSCVLCCCHSLGKGPACWLLMCLVVAQCAQQ